MYVLRVVVMWCMWNPFFFFVQLSEFEEHVGRGVKELEIELELFLFIHVYDDFKKQQKKQQKKTTKKKQQKNKKLGNEN